MAALLANQGRESTGRKDMGRYSSLIAALLSVPSAIISDHAGRTPEYDGKRYEALERKRGILLSFHCDNPDWVEKTMEIREGAPHSRPPIFLREFVALVCKRRH